MENRRTESNDESERVAEEMVDAVESAAPSEEDGFTKREQEIEIKKRQERLRKAQALRKQLRKRDLGLLHYRWPAAILLISGALAVWTNFLVVMAHPVGVGFDTYWDALFQTGNVFFVFPTISGAMMVVCGILAYSRPKATYFSVIPAMMMAMSGMMVYFLVSFAVAADPGVEVYSTDTPLSMLIIAVAALISIALKEKE
jgi:hypothetical protein